MKILILKENKETENRVAFTPDLAKKYIRLGFEILVEKDAGLKSEISNEQYQEVDAKIVDNIDEVLPEADIIASVQRTEINLGEVKKGAVFIATLNPHFQQEETGKLIDAGLSPFALELVPRITRAQSMDVLSSQSNLAGYVAVINAVANMKKCVPMMMTAAGTVSAAKIMILGAGVAGLQAIATSKRLGAVVCAFDVRAAAKEQVQSLGAKFVEVESDQDSETAGGYAKEMNEDYKKRQEELIAKTIAKQDIVISTALIPGKKAPILIKKEMVESMKLGSVVSDLAAVNGGNCELTKLNEINVVNGVKVIGHENFPSLVAGDASKLFAKNIYSFIELLVDRENKVIKIDLEDEILKASLLTKD